VVTLTFVVSAGLQRYDKGDGVCWVPCGFNSDLFDTRCAILGSPPFWAHYYKKRSSQIRSEHFACHGEVYSLEPAIESSLSLSLSITMKFALTFATFCSLLAFASAQNVRFNPVRYVAHFAIKQRCSTGPVGNGYCNSADGKEMLRCSDVRLKQVSLQRAQERCPRRTIVALLTIDFSDQTVPRRE
jgi:hypothetical protein